VHQRTPEGAPVPDGGIGDRAGGLCQQPAVLGHEGVVDDLVVRSPGADQQRVPGVCHASQLAEAAHVHQQFRVCQPQPQQRKQALPARDDLRVVTAVRQGPDRFVERAGTDIVELRRDHATPPSMSRGLLPWVWSLCRAACCSAALP
jgi:hypothetical protein